MTANLIKSSRPWLGSSGISAVLQLPNAGNRTPVTECLRLWGQEPEIDQAEEEFFEGRKALEPFVRHKLARLGLSILSCNVRYEHPEHPLFRAEIDAETADSNEEIKTGSEFTQRNFGEDGSDDFPVAYAAQVQWALMIRPKPMAHVNVQLGFDRRPLRFPVAPDAGLQRVMLEVAVAFMRDNVLAGILPPSINLSDARQVWPQSVARSVLASSAMMQSLERMAEIDRQAKQLAAERDALQLGVVAELGDAEMALAESGKPAVTYRTQKRDGYFVQPTEFRRFLNKVRAP